ncbi:tRNA (guanine-N(2)-)-methyltransferase [Gloeothece citriformis PCC 7424]|uniref:tRNA (Guanine-N(2)-)-methyltransferase n=1 Tax=Gloeothece citriformis (strain PCC 7424) TaxID=65393 RepID=B7KGT1_GLOC7|nr:tRNA (guanine-N1)-methyltransferase [Gloeothece citriformis]ACK73418.1 tRNA (guanine-N(2)-)-methyltransferase [Gloeothece citriformis PCC 7424]
MPTEGKANFIVGNAFYRLETKITRDLGILAAILYKSDTGTLRVIDGMTGCGVRALRYWLECDADWIWANDGNLDIEPILSQNLQDLIGAGRGKITYQEANRVFFECHSRKEYYDLVDVDCFGAPNPFLNSALWATKVGGLIYFTSTDGRTATGHLPQVSLRVYAAYARSHPSAHEQALRLMIGNVQYHAATLGLGIEPIFSLFTGSTYRVMVRLLSSSNLSEKNYGFLAYCHGCGEYQTPSWRKLGRVSCPCQHSKKPPILSGPLWLGNLHQPQFLGRMISLAEELGWLDRLDLLKTMQAEALLPPYFYPLSEIGKRGNMNLPKRSQLISALQSQGYQATIPHFNPQGIKTDASLAVCIEVGRSL